MRDGKLAGVILVGDTADSHRYMDWLRSQADLSSQRRQLLFPTPVEDAGLDVAEMPDSQSCLRLHGREQGRHHRGHSRERCQYAGATEGMHARLYRLRQLHGACASSCSKPLCLSSRKRRKESCANACLSAKNNLRDILRSQRLKSVQEVLDIYGNGHGCEVCKPALSYMLDMLWCGDHDEDRSARFINDRVHANIQKDGTFSVVPRMRGGVTSPEELRRIADVAEKYKVPMVKITGSQRIDLLGVKKADLPKIWADLGMPSGQAYTKGVRMVKTCVGTEFCRFGVQDSTRAGIELERRLEHLFTPHKVKMGAVGCPRNCAEATVKDIGLVGQDGSWQVVVGGAAGKKVRKADLLITVETTGRGARGSDALLPVLPRKCQLPGTHLRFRGTARHRQGEARHSVCAACRPAGIARTTSQIQTAGTRCLAGR